MTFGEISEQEFDAFAEAHPKGNFVQSAPMARRRANDGWRSYYLGLKDDLGVLVGAAVVNARNVAGRYADFECVQGPLLTYEASEQVEYFLRELARFARQHYALQLTVCPPVLASIRNGEGEVVVPEYRLGDQTTALLERVGFRHVDNNTTDATPGHIRWFFAKDLTPLTSYDQLLHNVDQQTRWSINKAVKNGVKVRLIEDEAGLAELYDIIEKTSERRGFSARTLGYYQSLFREFTREQAMFAIAYLDVDAYVLGLHEQVNTVTQELALYDEADPKMERRIRAGNEQLALYRKKLDEASDFGAQSTTIPLAASVFMHYGPEMVYFMSGSDARYKQFNGAYALQAFALHEAFERGVSRYNFYGTYGNFNGHPEQDGVYKFKYGFGGVVEEQVGYFVYTARPLLNRLRRLVAHVR